MAEDKIPTVTFNNAINSEQEATKKAKTSPTISNSKVSKNITSNTLETVNLLTSRFLKKVKLGKIDIHNTKELKDIITVFLQLHDINDGKTADTPEVNIQAAKFMGDQLREPHDNGNLNYGVQHKIPEMNNKQVDKFINNQAKQINNNNVKKM